MENMTNEVTEVTTENLVQNVSEQPNSKATLKDGIGVGLIALGGIGVGYALKWGVDKFKNHKKNKLVYETEPAKPRKKRGWFIKRAEAEDDEVIDLVDLDDVYTETEADEK